MGSAKLTILCGHYGCGKTNLALDLALEAAGQGRQVIVADLDLVNTPAPRWICPPLPPS